MSRAKCRSPFFIAFLGRSGSSHLVSLLSQHPDVRLADEPFLKANLARRDDPTKYQKWLVRHIYDSTDSLARGISVKYDQAFDEQGEETFGYSLLPKEEMVCISLKRNCTNAVISRLIYSQVREISGHANFRSGQERAREIDPIFVDCDRFVEMVADRTRAVATYETHCLKNYDNVLQITYEELVGDEGGVLEKIERALGLTTPFSSLAIEHKFEKAIKGNSWSMIRNADEVRSALSDAGFSDASS